MTKQVVVIDVPAWRVSVCAYMQVDEEVRVDEREHQQHCDKGACDVGNQARGDGDRVVRAKLTMHV